MVCFSAPRGALVLTLTNTMYSLFKVVVEDIGKWRARDQGQYKESIQAGALRQIEGFDPIIDQVLEPGDLLYIPPGFPHEGDTLEAKYELLNWFPFSKTTRVTQSFRRLHYRQ